MKIKEIIKDMFENPQDYSIFRDVCDEYWKEDEYEFNCHILDTLIRYLEDDDFTDIFCLDGITTPKRQEIVINYVKNYKV